jgi:hypothetical protein
LGAPIRLPDSGFQRRHSVHRAVVRRRMGADRLRRIVGRPRATAPWAQRSGSEAERVQEPPGPRSPRPKTQRRPRPQEIDRAEGRPPATGASAVACRAHQRATTRELDPRRSACERPAVRLASLVPAAWPAPPNAAARWDHPASSPNRPSRLLPISELVIVRGSQCRLARPPDVHGRRCGQRGTGRHWSQTRRGEMHPAGHRRASRRRLARTEPPSPALGAVALTHDRPAA